MKFYNAALLWTYFNNGYSLVSFPKWVLAVYGVGEVVNKNYFVVFVGAILFAFLCVLVGYLYVKSGFMEAMNEVQNQHNLLAKEIRQKIVKRKVYK